MDEIASCRHHYSCTRQTEQPYWLPVNTQPSEKINSVPLPGSRSPLIQPPWRCIARCTEAKPMPAPSNS